MKNKILLIISIIPVIVSGISVFFMNDTIPVHYNINGVADRYGSKFEILILPAIILVCYFIWILYIKFYSSAHSDNSEKVKSNVNVIYIFAISINLCLAVLNFVFLITSLKNLENMYEFFDMFFIVNCVLSVTFIIVGNFMPKIKRNNFIGVRTSLTKSNDTAWYIFNKNSGIAFVLAGIVSIIESFIVKGIDSTLIMVFLLSVFNIIAYIYSYITYKKK